MSSPSPLWPNPAPRGPIQRTHRNPGDARSTGNNVYRVGSHTIQVIDGEPLEDIMNRVYALGLMHGHVIGRQSEDLAVDLAVGALKELAGLARLREKNQL